MTVYEDGCKKDPIGEDHITAADQQRCDAARTLAENAPRTSACRPLDPNELMLFALAEVTHVLLDKLLRACEADRSLATRCALDLAFCQRAERVAGHLGATHRLLRKTALL